ncbi:MAG TPA: MarR family winged helix-turn-helix transcriptional regulator [Rhizomicrobium sp.]|nr:MarR family winged helix-turn-helix transcriptional regulator [Rhizomicrobium sp.]
MAAPRRTESNLMQSPSYLIVPLLQGFYWFDEGLQNYLRAKGWSKVTRAQSMIMVNVITGTRKPSDIARVLGISRQAVHATIEQMIEMDLVKLVDDPEDGRAKILELSEGGERRRKDARRAVVMLTKELSTRIGKQNVQNLLKAFSVDWGKPPDRFPQKK